MAKKLTTESFIEKSRKLHGKKYDYSKVKYMNNETKVCIICPEHGEFWQTPKCHLQGKKCPKCTQRNYKYTTEEWIEKAKEKHSNKYDYSKVNYISNHTKVCIICPEHGEFWQDAAAHLRGQGCPKCADISNGLKRLMTNDEFIEKARKVHGDKYDYSKVKYINSRSKVCIICPEHGEFWQTPAKHLSGHGCAFCNEYKMEEKIKLFLNENNVKYKYQYRNEWLKNNNGNFLSIDFYLPEYNLAIECQGVQHFKSVEYFGGNDRFHQQIINDKTKRNLCEKHNVNILYVIEKRVKTSIDLYNDNMVLVDKITMNKIKNASH